MAGCLSRNASSGPIEPPSNSPTERQRKALEEAFRGQVASDTTVMLFGSIAREEMTLGSDTDWILLVDGQAFPEHEDQTRDVACTLKKNGFGEPGRSGVFGCMVASHSMVHKIGGEDDTNSNTTRRVLLLFESFPIGDKAAVQTCTKTNLEPVCSRRSRPVVRQRQPPGSQVSAE